MLELDFLAAVFGLFTLIKMVVYPKIKNLMSSIIGTSSDSAIISSWLKIGVYLKTKEKKNWWVASLGQLWIPLLKVVLDC